MRKEGMFLNPTALRLYVRLPPVWQKAILSRSAPGQHVNAAKLWIDHWYSKESMVALAKDCEFMICVAFIRRCRINKIKFVEEI